MIKYKGKLICPQCGVMVDIHYFIDDVCMSCFEDDMDKFWKIKEGLK